MSIDNLESWYDEIARVVKTVVGEDGMQNDLFGAPV